MVHSNPVDKEYIRDGRFIHDELLRRCDGLPAKATLLFRRDRCIHPTLLIWPADTVQATDGKSFSGVIFTSLPPDKEARRQLVRDAIIRATAFAAVLTEQLDDCIRIIFESAHGTRTWRLPIKNFGGIQVLAFEPPSDNTESIGVLWAAS